MNPSTAYQFEQIQKIPISTGRSSDEFVWHFTNDRIFTVKSAYLLGLEFLRSQKGSSSGEQQGKLFWNRLWNLHVPPRVSIFLWKASKAILATNMNLSSRLKTMNKDCRRCHSPHEFDKHVFFECAEAKEVWKELHIEIPHKSKFSSFQEWLAEILENKSKYEGELITMILWLIWKSRNEEIFEGKSRGAKQICAYAISLLQEFQALTSNRVASVDYQNTLNFDSKWKPPEEGIGIVVKDHEGEVQAILVELIPHCCNVEHAKVLAILKALNFAKDFDLSHVVLESDALCVINKINKDQSNFAQIGTIIEDIRVLKMEFPVIRIQFSGRKTNRVAHEASRLAFHVKSYFCGLLTSQDL